MWRLSFLGSALFACQDSVFSGFIFALSQAVESNMLGLQYNMEGSAGFLFQTLHLDHKGL